MFRKFVEERMKALEEKIIYFFTIIPKLKIQIELEKLNVKNNTLDVIKEDGRDFGLLLGNVKTPGEAIKYPLTTVELALAVSDQTFRQQFKVNLRKLLYEKLDSIVRETPVGVDWLVDGMAAVAIVLPQETNKDFADEILS